MLRRRVRRQHNRLPEPSMVMVDTQVVKGGRAGRGWPLTDMRWVQPGTCSMICFPVILEKLLGACCEVYNAGLAERRDAWKMAGKSIAVFDQFNRIAALRGVRDDVLVWGIQPLRGALRRLDEAYSAFYRRCRAGQTPGHPRFRSHRRFDTVCWDEPTSWGRSTSDRGSCAPTVSGTSRCRSRPAAANSWAAWRRGPEWLSP